MLGLSVVGCSWGLQFWLFVFRRNDSRFCVYGLKLPTLQIQLLLRLLGLYGLLFLLFYVLNYLIEDLALLSLVWQLRFLLLFLHFLDRKILLLNNSSLQIWNAKNGVSSRV